MFDQVPVRVWLLIAIGAIAFTPARYVYRYIVHSPAGRDITKPAPDLSWRDSSQFVRNLGILAGLLGLAIFIFTPTADQFARSPRFWPILMAAFGAWALLSVAKGFVTGGIQPFIKGIYGTYDRDTQTKRFWASMAWNAALGTLFIWIALGLNEDTSAEITAAECRNANLLKDRRLACDEVIRLRPNDADGYFDRGLMSLNSYAFDEAIADFTRAHELDPKDPWPIANRGIAFAWKKDRANAEKDFEAVRVMDPSNPVMLRGEALVRMNAGDLRGAAERLTASMVRDPDNLWALRTRSEVYSELGEHEKSREDDTRWLRLKESRAAHD
jgi:tetratricopeptide (TPR) repeat protein